MMTVSTIGMLAALAELTVLGACVSTGATNHKPSTCRPALAAALISKTAPNDAAIMQSTGSSIVRRIAPGDPTTKDYRPERVTVTIAEVHVVASSCG